MGKLSREQSVTVTGGFGGNVIVAGIFGLGDQNCAINLVANFSSLFNLVLVEESDTIVLDYLADGCQD